MKFLFTLTLALLASIVHSQNLIVKYDFDRSYADSASHGYSLATTQGTGAGPSYVTGKKGSALQFNNGKGAVSAPMNNANWKGTAIAFWVKGNAIGLVSQGAYLGWGIDFNTMGKVSAFFGGSSSRYLEVNTSIADGKWHHVVAQNNGRRTSLYIDAKLDTFQNETLYRLPSPNTNARNYLGIDRLGNNRFNSIIDEFMIFDDTLCQSQINEIFTNGKFNCCGSVQIIRDTIRDTLTVRDTITIRDTISTRDTITITDTLYIRDTIYIEDSTKTGIVPMRETLEYKVYPNPTHGHLVIKGIREEEARIKVLDPRGREVQTPYRETQIGPEERQLNVVDLPSGTYFLRTEKETIRIVKE